MRRFSFGAMLGGVCFGGVGVFAFMNLPDWAVRRTERPIALVGSFCSASEFLVHTAENIRSAPSFVVLPLDSDALQTRACEVATKALVDESFLYQPLRWLPRRFVCDAFMEYGISLEYQHSLGEWPLILLREEEPFSGVSAATLSALGMSIDSEGYRLAVEAYSKTSGQAR